MILSQYQYWVYKPFFNTSFDLCDAGSKILIFFLSMKDNYWTKSSPVYKLVIIVLFEVIESYTLFKPKTINLILFISKGRSK